MNDVQVILDKSAIKSIEKKATRALALTAKVLQDDIRQEQIIPRDMGYLQNEKFYVNERNAEKGVVSLVFEGPYARRLYFNPQYHFSHVENPNAQGLWLTPWLSHGKYQKRPKEIFDELIKRGL